MNSQDQANTALRIWQALRGHPIERRLAAIDAALPPAANDTTLVITEAQLDRALGAVAHAIKEKPHALA
ncbi:MAG: hypothetical protein ACOY6K_12490 [Pseudomonadota bacterium]